MRVVALLSGGKDSCYSMQLCHEQGHEIVALANLYPGASARLQPGCDEADSYMYQTVGHGVLEAYAAATGLPLFRREIEGVSLNTALVYERTEGDEVEDLHALLADVVAQVPGVQGVSSGAILSDYQRLRVESVCARLGLTSLALMWRREQRELLQSMVGAGVDAIVVKVAAMGLTPTKHLGRSIAELFGDFCALEDQFGFHVCGEGGEYETLTLDCALFVKRLVLDECRTVVHSDDAFAPVAYLQPVQFHLEDKPPPDAAAAALAPSDGHGHFAATKREIDAWAERWVGSLSTAEAAQLAPKRGASGAEAARPLAAAEVNAAPVAGRAHAFAAGRGGGTAAAQMDACMADIEKQLSASGVGWGDVFYAWLYLRDLTNFGAVNAVYCSRFGASPPSRVCVAALLESGCEVAIECMAVREDRRVLHVQSISHWAPTCIGPYSQASTVGGLVHCAGQIALEPCSMSMVQEEPWQELLRCAEGSRCVLEAQRASLASVAFAAVYVAETVAELDARRLAALAAEYFREKSDTEPVIGLVRLHSLPKGAAVEVQLMATAASSGESEDAAPADALLVENRSFGDVAVATQSRGVAGAWCVVWAEAEDGAAPAVAAVHSAALKRIESLGLSWSSVASARLYCSEAAARELAVAPLAGVPRIPCHRSGAALHVLCRHRRDDGH